MSDATTTPAPVPPAPSKRDAVLSVLSSKTIWLALLTGVAAPLARALGAPESLASDEMIGALATVAALIVATRATTTKPLTQRLDPPK